MDAPKFKDGDKARITYNTEPTYSSIRGKTLTIKGDPHWMSEPVFLGPGDRIPELIPNYRYEPDEEWIVKPTMLPEWVLEAV